MQSLKRTASGELDEITDPIRNDALEHSHLCLSMCVPEDFTFVSHNDIVHKSSSPPVSPPSLRSPTNEHCIIA